MFVIEIWYFCNLFSIFSCFTVWEIATGRCVKTFEVDGTVRCVTWCPNSAISLIAAAVDQYVYLINPGVGDRLIQAKTDEILKQSPDQAEYMSMYSWFLRISDFILTAEIVI